MFAVEDGMGGVWCADDSVVTAQLAEFFGKAPKLWRDRNEAEQDGRKRFGRCRVVVVDAAGVAAL